MYYWSAVMAGWVIFLWNKVLRRSVEPATLNGQSEVLTPPLFFS